MENATKALLIAAAVLIAIVIVALGVNLLASTGDTNQKAEQVGEELEVAVGSVANELEDDLKFDLKKLYKKIGKGSSTAPNKYSKQLEKVYLCKYDGTLEQVSKFELQLEDYIEGKSINPYFSIIPVKLTTNDVYNKILEITSESKNIGITTTDYNVVDSEGKYKILVIIAVTGVEH